MELLNKILGRPSHDKPFVLLVAGHPAKNSLVPDIARKPLSEIGSFVAIDSSVLHPGSILLFLSIFDFEMIVCVSSEPGDSGRLLDYSV
jgi:hypothetical protein